MANANFFMLWGNNLAKLTDGQMKQGDKCYIRVLQKTCCGQIRTTSLNCAEGFYL
jgi:hypothetical protein